MDQNDIFETVIGLEVHIELKTETKLFCSCKNVFGSDPNTSVCPVCLGMPGTLPLLNEKAVEFAVTAGLAIGAEICNHSSFDRKNYQYPDLPKAYQITQFFHPICLNGKIDIETENGIKSIGITRLHIEEDAGKLIHDSGNETLIDYNRAGVPLIEIVSEPDISSSFEAVQYLKKLRQIMLSAKVSDCKMNEGSMRADVNVSVRKKGEEKFGVRTEIKNINSFAFVGKAIDYEAKRQIAELENGRKIIQETRRFDPATGKTFVMRSKENADDYRYFPDPDLPPLCISEKYIENLRNSLPELPDEKKEKLCRKYGLSPDDARIFSEDDALYSFFLCSADFCPHFKTLSNLILSELKRLLPPEYEKIEINHKHFSDIVTLFSENKINSPVAKQLIKKLYHEDFDPIVYTKGNGLLMISDISGLTKIAKEVFSENPKIVSDYLSGKTAAIKSLMGLCMKKTGGKADPVILDKIICNLLSEKTY